MEQSEDRLEVSPELLARFENISSKRARIVLEHILKHGYITTEEITEKYGYSHPPRAAGDIRDNGIALEKFRVPDKNGKTITAYKLADIPLEQEKSGRKLFTKTFKKLLLTRDGEQCALCGGRFPGNTLQIDHKVPFEIVGDKDGDLNPNDFMLLCGSCNRAKSWECEHCPNRLGYKEEQICKTCMFGSPDSYEHIATKQRRSLTLNWAEDEVQDYDILKRESIKRNQEIDDYVKELLKSRTINMNESNSTHQKRLFDM